MTYVQREQSIIINQLEKQLMTLTVVHGKVLAREEGKLQ